MTLAGVGRFTRCSQWNGGPQRTPNKGANMKRNSAQLGDFGDLAAWDEINPIWGYVVGGGLTGAAILTSKALSGTSPRLNKYAGLIGLAVGVGVSAVSCIFHKTRRAGYLGLVGSLLTAVPEIIRSMVLVPKGLGDAEDEFGYTSADQVAFGAGPALEIMGPGFGAPVDVIQGGMGLTTADFQGAGSVVVA